MLPSWIWKRLITEFDWLAFWKVLRIYGMEGKLLSAMKSFYEAASACVKINGETS